MIKKFKLTYIYRGEYDGENMPSVIVEAEDRLEAIRKFLKQMNVKNVSQFDYFYDEEV